jgi:hypothetical protein
VGRLRLAAADRVVVGQPGQLSPEGAGRARVDKPDQQRDFFVSYTQADRAWAEWLAWELEAAGYTTVLQAWDMPAGTAFVHAMDQAVRTTRHVLLVLSPACLRSEMAEAEWRPGFKADPSGEQRRLLPVQVEACEPAGCWPTGSGSTWSAPTRPPPAPCSSDQ